MEINSTAQIHKLFHAAELYGPAKAAPVHPTPSAPSQDCCNPLQNSTMSSAAFYRFTKNFLQT